MSDLAACGALPAPRRTFLVRFGRWLPTTAISSHLEANFTWLRLYLTFSMLDHSYFKIKSVYLK